MYDDARYRERKESAGLFAAIPSLLKSLGGGARGGGGGGGQLALPAGGTSEAYRDGGRGYQVGGGRARWRVRPRARWCVRVCARAQGWMGWRGV